MKRSKKNLQKLSLEKKSSTPSNGKQVEKPNKIKNASAEEKILHGQQAKDHSLQPNAIDVICKSTDYVKIKVFSELNGASVLPEKKSSVILPRLSISSVTAEECCYDINVDQNVSQEKCQDPVPDTICNKNSDAKRLRNARCLKVTLHKWCENSASAAAAKTVEVCFCSSLNGLPIDHLKESESEPATHSDSKENTQRKRICSGSKENIQCKRVKTSDEIKQNICVMPKNEGNLLEKIKLMIHERMEVLNSDFFDRKLKGLSGRVEQAQCLKKHEELALTFLKKVAKLERRINTVITFQKKVMSKMFGHQTRLPNADSQNTILNRLGSSASFPNIVNMQQCFSRKLLLPSHIGFTSAFISEDASSDEVLQISGEGQNSATANNSDVPNNQINTQAAMSAATQSEIKERKLKMIDLTEEEKQNSSKGKTENTQEPVLHKQNSKSACLNSACVKLTAETADEDPKQFPHLPPLPRTPLCAELAEEFRDTLPPQMPQLKVAQVQNPKRIALSWTIKELDPKCAPLDSYHLYLCQENSRDTSASRWKKIGTDKNNQLAVLTQAGELNFSCSNRYSATSPPTQHTYIPSLKTRDSIFMVEASCAHGYIHLYFK